MEDACGTRAAAPLRWRPAIFCSLLGLALLAPAHLAAAQCRKRGLCESKKHCAGRRPSGGGAILAGPSGRLQHVRALLADGAGPARRPALACRHQGARSHATSHQPAAPCQAIAGASTQVSVSHHMLSWDGHGHADICPPAQPPSRRPYSWLGRHVAGAPLRPCDARAPARPLLVRACMAFAIGTRSLEHRDHRTRWDEPSGPI